MNIGFNTFLKQNPNFNWDTDNLARPAIADAQNWEGLDKEKLLPQLQTYQRLLRITPQSEVVEAIMEAGFHSSHQIALTREPVFTAQVSPTLEKLEAVPNGAKVAKQIWNNSRIMMAQVNQMVMATLPNPDGLAILKHEAVTESFEQDLPSYSELFGPQHFCECEECRSIWGPAAYFTDLMRLIDQYITQPSADSIPEGLSLQERRPDLWNMELNCLNTYHEESYLKIANAIMAQKLSGDLGENVLFAMSGAAYPFSLPINLPEEEIKRYLQDFRLSLASVYQRFWADESQVARTSLNLSSDKRDLLTTDSSGNLEIVYGLYADESADQLDQANLFLQKTGLNGIDLDALLYQECQVQTNNGQTVELSGRHFNGNQNQSDSQHVTVNNNSALQTGLSGTQTVSFWIRPDQFGGSIIYKNHVQEIGVILHSSGQIGYLFGDSQNQESDYQEYTIHRPLQKGEWTHITFVRDMDAKLVYAYFNGERLHAESVRFDAISSAGTPLRFGAGYFGGMKGALSEISLWSRVLTGSEILGLMSTTLPENTSGLVGYWPILEGDQSGNGHDGNLNEGPSNGKYPTRTIPETVQYFLSQTDTTLSRDFFINGLLTDGAALALQTTANTEGKFQCIQSYSTAGDWSAPNAQTFDRLHRFIRLSKSINWNFADLDWALRSVDAADIDDNAIKELARVQELLTRFNLPVGQATALFADVKTIGHGEGLKSNTLFDRTFNQPQVFYTAAGDLPKAYHPTYSFNALFMDDPLFWNPIPNNAHPATTQDSQLRTRLLAALQLTEPDMTALTFFLDANNLWSIEDLPTNGSAPDYCIYLTVQNLSLLYRYSALAKVLKMNLSHLLRLLPLIPDLPATFINSVKDVVTIVENVAAVKSSGLTLLQMEYLISPRSNVPVALQNQVSSRLQQAQQRLATSSVNVLLTAQSFVSNLMGEAEAEVCFRALIDNDFITEDGIVRNLRMISTDEIYAVLSTNLQDLAPDVVSSEEKANLSSWESSLPQAIQSTLSARTINAEARSKQKLQLLSRQVSEVIAQSRDQQEANVLTALTGAYKAKDRVVDAAVRLSAQQLASVPSFAFAQKQYVHVPWSGSLQPTDEITISTWVRFHSFAGQSFNKSDTPVSQYFYSSVKEYAGIGFFTWPYESDSSLGVVLNGSMKFASWNIELNCWYHIMVAVQNIGENSNVHFYCNGKLINEDTTFPTKYSPITQNPADSFLGSYGGVEGFVDGSFAHLRIYGTAILDEATAQNEMNSLVPPDELRDDLCAWWPMTTGGGRTVYDWSGNGNTGTAGFATSTNDGATFTPTSLDAPDYNLRLLLNPEPSAEQNTDAMVLLQSLDRNVAWMQALRLSDLEALSISSYSPPFGVPHMRYGFRPGYEDLISVSLYKQQSKHFTGGAIAYLAYLGNLADANDLDTTDAAAAQKRQLLSDVAGWDTQQLEYLIGKNPNAEPPLYPGDNYNTVEGVQSLLDCFAVSEALGTNIDVPISLVTVGGKSVCDDAVIWNEYTAMAGVIKNALNLHYSPETLKQALAPIEGQIDERTRDLLSNWLLWELGATFGDLQTLDDLYEFLLVDVKTTSVVNISPLKLGLNSLQLYVQRCMANLENGTVCTIPKDWWSWMSDYREWQANREVYLYPENYVDPSLRKMQSPLFKDLVTQMKQSPVSKESATKAYLNYLDGLKEIANLEIVDSCVWTVESFKGSSSDPKLRRMALFGRTKSNPTTFYWREALVPCSTGVSPDDNNISWTPWQNIGLSISSRYVTPVRAFGKLFIFWAEQQQASSNYDGISYPYITATIYYSFQKAGSAWIQPQVVTDNLLIKTMDQNGESAHYWTGFPFNGFWDEGDYENQIEWQKPTATLIPATADQPSQILITLGNLVTVGDPWTLGENNPLPLTFEQKRALKQAKAAYDIATSISPNLTTVVPAFLLTSGLEKREVFPDIDTTNMSFETGATTDQAGGRFLVLAEANPVIICDRLEYSPLLFEVPSNNLFDKRYPVDCGSQRGNPVFNDISGPYGEQISALHYNKGQCMELNVGGGHEIIPPIFTFGTWFKYDDAINDDTLHALLDCRSTIDSKGLTVYIKDNGVILEITYSEFPQTSPITTQVNTWYYLVVSCNDNNPSIRIYDENGQQVGTTKTNSRKFVPTSHGTLRIGAGDSQTTTPNFYYAGYIVSPKIWPSNLPESVLQAEIHSGSGLLLENLPYKAEVSVVKNQPDWFTLNSGSESFLAIPTTGAATPVGNLLEVSYNQNLVSLNLVTPLTSDEDSGVRFIRTSSNVVEEMLEKLFEGGLKSLLSPASQYLFEPDFKQYQPNAALVEGPSSDMMNFNGAYGGYFWELFYHIPLYLARSLQADQKFGEAQKWFDVVFDPTGTGHSMQGMVGFWPLTLESVSTDAQGNYSITDLQRGQSLAFVPANSGKTPQAVPHGSLGNFGPRRSYLDFSQGYFSGPEIIADGAFTIEFWMTLKSGMNTSWRKVIGQDSGSAPTNGWLLRVKGPTDSSESGVLEMIMETNSQEMSSDIPVTLSPGTWFHLALTYDPTAPEMALYIDGKKSSVQITDRTFTYSSGSFSIGGVAGHQYPLDSFEHIANVVLWNHVRNTDQIRQDMAMLRYSDGKAPLSEQLYYFLFRPFGKPGFQSTYDTLVNEPVQTLLYEYDPFDPDAIASQRTSAYKKTTVMQYIANLIAYGDYLFTQDTWESINSATLCYDTASELLGRPPKPEANPPKRQDKSYADLATASPNGQVPTFLIDMEAEVPPVSSTSSKQQAVQYALEQHYSVVNAYFCVPSNTQLLNYRKTVEDRLYKIRHGLNIQGQPNDIPLFQPPINPDSLVQASGSSSGSASAAAASPSIPYYRFSYLLQVAKGFAAQVSSLGNELLVALEKQDAEHLELLRETQGNTILGMTSQIRENQVNQLYAQQSSLQANLAAAQTQLSTYQQWIETSWNDYELRQFLLQEESLVFSSSASLFTAIGAPLYLFPTIFGLADGGMNIGGSWEAVGKFMGEVSGILTQSAQITGMNGSFERTNDEWNLQVQLAQNSINGINAQLKGIQYEIQSAQQDYNINQTQIQQSNDVINFLQTKFTSEELYQWMTNQLSTIYFQAYSVALNLAQMAQTAYQYELSSGQAFVSNSGWNSLYKGLLAGDILSQNLQQMEQAYVQNNSRMLEIEKTISLMQLVPEQLIRLRQTGSCSFSLSELLFDRDYPGQYNRMIASISITIPAVVGPYQNLHATLTQTSNQVLTSPNVEGVKYMMGITPTAPNSGVVRSNWNSNQAIAISTGTNDSGMFQLNFNDERYLPFEGTGAVSDWVLGLPKASNQFNFEAISDVIVNVKYNAYNGGATFRDQVINISNGDETYPLKDYGATKFISMMQYYGLAWTQLLNTKSSSIELVRSMFPPNADNLSIISHSRSSYPVFGTGVDSENAGLEVSLCFPSDYEDNDPFAKTPLAIGVSVTLTSDSPLLTEDGKIDPSKLKDLIIVVPYTAELDWS